MAILYASTLFLSATLLFWVQPMVAKMLLPLLGGSPSVWNTCMVFFQAALLAGYLYAHWASRWLGSRVQVVLHLALLGLAALVLPMELSGRWLASLPDAQNPAGWLLACLAALVGLPFFLVSSTAPLLQRWFSRSGHREAHDPYFLYSASNLGSMLALLGYPLLLEPLLRLRSQAIAWTFGYLLLVFLIAACGARLWRTRAAPEAPTQGVEEPSAERQPGSGPTGDSLSARRRLFWVLLAFVPSSLMLGVTAFLTTDIASFPLLWVMPLSLYLLTFVLVFARRAVLPLAASARVLPFAALGVIFLMITRTTEPAWLILLPHLLFFFIAAMVCHGRLAADRPAPRHLTEFYIWMSVGGVAGGVFNALLAPHLFRNVIEYPLAIALACLLIPPRRRAEGWMAAPQLDAVLPVGLGLATLGLAWGLPQLGLESGTAGRLLVAGVPAFFVFTFASRPIRFGLGVAAVLLGGWQFLAPKGETLFLQRNFFGVSRVQREAGENLHRLIHGNTFHGRQYWDSARRCLPLAYYHNKGPFADVVDAFNREPAASRVAVIGLGGGTMASYIQAGQHWTFYEIDPAVIQIAQDTNLFSYLHQCAQGTWNIVPGDARLKLQKAPDHHYGLIVLDAFSSDAIPVHLLTREAVALYRSKLAPGGLLAFHVSNRYLDLRPVLGALARDAGWLCRARHDRHVTPEDKQAGKDPSHWAVLARTGEDFGPLGRLADWEPVSVSPAFRAWTDDYSNLISVFNWQ